MKKNPLFIVLGLSAAFFFVFMIIAVIAVTNLTSGSKSQKKLFTRSKSLGVIELSGVIMDSKKTLQQIENASEDPSIKGLIVRINSPGGSVGPSQEIYDALRKLGKKMPVYSSMASLAASGGYYVACGTKKIYANPGTLTGSIGVIMHFADMSRLFQWAKVNPYVVKTGKFKDIGSPNREMGAEEKALLQSMIDNVLSQFRKAVSVGRNIPYEKVVPLSDGRIFSGEQAKQNHLVDELGGFNDAVEAMAKEVGIGDKPKLIYLSKKKKLFERLLDDDPEEAEGSRFEGRWGAVVSLLKVFTGEASEPSFDAVGGALSGPMFLAPFFSR